MRNKTVFILLCSFIFSGCAAYHRAQYLALQKQAALPCKELKNIYIKRHRNVLALLFGVLKGRLVPISSAFMYSKRGIVVTASHSLEHKMERYIVAFDQGGKPILANVFGIFQDKQRDVAYLVLDRLLPREVKVRQKPLGKKEIVYAVALLAESREKQFLIRSRFSCGQYMQETQLVIKFAKVNTKTQVLAFASVKGVSGAPVFDKNGLLVGVLNMSMKFNNGVKLSLSTPVRFLKKF